jgi:hypothetical protein
LSDARREFEVFVDARLTGLDDAAKYTALDDLATLLQTRLGFVLFEVDDEADVGVMFEVMNARGKRLTQFELVKNYLLFAAAKVSSGDALRQLTQAVNQTWSEVVRVLDEAGLSAEDDTFLRYHWYIWPHAKGLDGESLWKTHELHRAVKTTIPVSLGEDDRAGAGAGLRERPQGRRAGLRGADEPAPALGLRVCGPAAGGAAGGRAPGRAHGSTGGGDADADGVGADLRGRSDGAGGDPAADGGLRVPAARSRDEVEHGRVVADAARVADPHRGSHRRPRSRRSSRSSSGTTRPMRRCGRRCWFATGARPRGTSTNGARCRTCSTSTSASS